MHTPKWHCQQWQLPNKNVVSAWGGPATITIIVAALLVLLSINHINRGQGIHGLIFSTLTIHQSSTVMLAQTASVSSHTTPRRSPYGLYGLDM